MWRGSECAATLEGHEGPVLSLAVTPDGDILSGSGDTTIRRWSGGKCVQTYKGHTDTVRCAGARRHAAQGGRSQGRDVRPARPARAAGVAAARARRGAPAPAALLPCPRRSATIPAGRAPPVPPAPCMQPL